MFLRRVVTRAAEVIGVAKDRKELSGEAWKVARGMNIGG